MKLSNPIITLFCLNLFTFGCDVDDRRTVESDDEPGAAQESDEADAPSADEAALVSPEEMRQFEEYVAEVDPEEQDDTLEDDFIRLHLDATTADDLAVPTPVSEGTLYPAKCHDLGVEYHVTFKTGSMLYAGTSANVKFRFRGTYGGQTKWTPWLYQSGKGYLFERGQVDQVDKYFQSPGPIDYIELAHDNSGLSAGWYVEWVTVLDTCSGKMWRADVNRWLDLKVGTSLMVKRPMYED